MEEDRPAPGHPNQAKVDDLPPGAGHHSRGSTTGEDLAKSKPESLREGINLSRRPLLRPPTLPSSTDPQKDGRLASDVMISASGSSLEAP